ncbi:Major facilitator superfamily domain-containing protein 7 [Cercospora beticola]|uniref:Major facilitator superfamily domain-containing protein 7 n=2 Tax=Cercospora beticola TaxID=122368 RepID=A0A2G5HQB0_CERBT|nr:Major facilitator superfamily domain-containing protein 7 [Cercospora beticola]PIA94463.1 Major facilitator superfamily domain-containing protein 7 [Cercospora beticola]
MGGYMYSALPTTQAASDNMDRIASTSTAAPDGYPLHYSDTVDGHKSNGDHDDTDLELANSATALRQDFDHDLLTRTYRVYKARWFGLVQLLLLNAIVSWDWLTFAAVSDTSAKFFRVKSTGINWLSTAFLFAFALSAPATIWVLNKYGPKASITIASVLILIGNWIRYAGAAVDDGYFYVVLAGQLLIGLAQPFVLAAPTRYSDMWFSDAGRVGAIAVTSLANPLGGAIGQIVGPLFASKPSDVPNMVLYVSIISSAATIPSLFLPAKPPTPPSARAEAPKLDLHAALRQLPRNGSFYLMLAPFAVYVGCFNATSSLITQIFHPYGISEDDAGLAGGILIIAGLVASAIMSPIVDRTKKHLWAVKILVPIIAIAYTVLIFMPLTRDIVGPYVVCGVLGAASFSLLPVALDLLTIVTFPVSPEVSSVVAWTGGQLLGAIFIVVMDQLKGGWDGQPAKTMLTALIFQAGMAWLVVPCALLLGVWKFRKIIVGSDPHVVETPPP